MHSLYRTALVISTAIHAAAVPLRRSPTSQTGYSSIVVFGDSFSDNGNGAYKVSNGTWPLVPPYYQGRFSNGPIWAEYLAANLSLPLHDYATGGATTANTLIQGFTGPKSTIAVPSVTDQIEAFLASPPQSDATDSPLFVLWAGANDIFFNPNISAAQSYQAISSAASTLLAAYPACRVVTVSSPDLSRLPYGFYANALTKAQLHSFTNLLAGLLADGARGNAAVDNIDLRGLFDEFEYYASPEAYGFAPLGKYGSCLVGVYDEGDSGAVSECENVGEWVYWDEYHPTTQTHSWIAQEFLDALS